MPDTEEGRRKRAEDALRRDENADTEEDRRARQEGAQRRSRIYRNALRYNAEIAAKAKEEEAARPQYLTVSLDACGDDPIKVSREIGKGLRQAKKDRIGNVILVNSLAGMLPLIIKDALEAESPWKKLVDGIVHEDHAVTIVRVRLGKKALKSHG